MNAPLQSAMLASMIDTRRPRRRNRRRRSALRASVRRVIIAAAIASAVTLAALAASALHRWNAELAEQAQAEQIRHMLAPALRPAGLAFLDIDATGPLVALLDLIHDADAPLDWDSLAQDLHKARREFTLEELPAELHAARIAALAQLRTA